MAPDVIDRYLAQARAPSDHALRISLSEIMHGRSLRVEALPARIRQWLILHREGDRDPLATWLDRISAGQSSSAAGRFAVETSDASHVWEAHTEFSTITMIRTGAASRDPIDTCEWLDGLPGEIFRSVEILVGGEADFSWNAEAELDPSRAVSSLAFGGVARILSDFTIKRSHAGMIFIKDEGLQNDEPARLVQTLLEIGNYRKLALLGFPVARELIPWLTSAEARHAAISEKINSPSHNRADVLTELLNLSAEVECRASRARYRLGATSSYNLLTRDRLVSLREVRLPGYSTWAEFIERRLLPAMRTCEISQSRLDGLSERINRSASLLSLEQNVALNTRSQASLASMNRRAMLQLRLQSLVEGFSIFAISYYIINLLEHLLGAVSVPGDEPQSKMIVAGLVPLVLAAVWLFMRRRRPTTQAALPADV